MIKWLVTLSVTPLKKKNANKYLVLDVVDKNKEVSKKYKEIWEGVKKKLKRLMMTKKLNMRKILKKLGLNLTMIFHWINL